ncbi:NAD-dependent epimerase/dehydratase (macronuclear) [Tetrahymena thermophila SB210]|uniref:NAD-dependent epimerase/dehydratase n=1 Tax=Tetrahymena thermophila (strain SB210) TaxID=312017 RepID=I7LUS2_TETTS|nr:NAD-dependent epimerase/dehydratase [Tetrahymena thermophila SB210]EAR95790.2 NAD-dependent epimerase/dehydratase [Tetrahymena thermophila SB210]|eukprot:XP_001016035.2 NAD-dependent epimerase/dehydratase [Tetrahymena thermophila SB210]
MGEKKYILVLGGSTFMGLQLLQNLCSSENEDYEVYYINRGKKYWNNQVKNIKNAHHIFGNRKEKQEYRKLIEYESKKLGIDGKKKWTAVFDFCGFKYSEVKSAYEALKGKCELYLFISTDSIYDVCDKSVRKEGQPIKEEMACRPKTLTKQAEYKKDDDYAHHKLKCEEFLYNYVEKEELPFVILRLPDVIGPFDDTGRFWAYMKWITEFNKNTLYMDDEANNLKMSFVYSQDVADICLKLINMPKDNILHKSYNIACEEVITLKQMIEQIAKIMDIKLVNIKNTDNASKFYPSVDCGPIDITLAKQMLGWNPTPLEEVLEKTVTFFKQAKGKYREEENYAEKKLYKKIKTD